MRRILSFTDFYCVLFDFMRLSGAMIITDYLLLAVIPRRIGANAIRSKSNQVVTHDIIKSVKDKIRRIGVIRDLFERVRTEP